METTKTTKVAFSNIKQSKSWEKYLHALGWHSLRLSNGALLVYFKSVFGSLGKMQRPGFLDEESLRELYKTCRKHKFLFLKLEPSADQDISLLKRFGFASSNTPLGPTTTLFIDLLKSEDSLWRSISHNGKYDIRKGKEEGNRSEFIKNPSTEQLKLFYKSIQKYRAQDKGYHIPSFNDLLLKKKSFGDNTYLSLIYDKNNKLCGGKFYVTYDDVVFYSSGGTTKEGLNNRSGILQMWESLLFFKKGGFKYLDLDGVADSRFPKMTKDWKGFSRFKAKFGGTYIKYPVPYIKIYNPWIKFLVDTLKLNL